tara:strand:- start:117 stop:335 length:219 start_codon:yes stop_codon:yes gene_type:complete
VANQKVEELIVAINQLLIDSINKDIEQYNAEEELWNTEVQSKIADRIANKINTVINNVRFQEEGTEKDWEVH